MTHVGHRALRGVGTGLGMAVALKRMHAAPLQPSVDWGSTRTGRGMGGVMMNGCLPWYHRRKNLDGDKTDMDKSGTPPSYHMFPSM